MKVVQVLNLQTRGRLERSPSEPTHNSSGTRTRRRQERYKY